MAALCARLTPYLHRRRSLSIYLGCKEPLFLLADQYALSHSARIASYVFPDAALLHNGKPEKFAADLNRVLQSRRERLTLRTKST